MMATARPILFGLFLLCYSCQQEPLLEFEEVPVPIPQGVMFPSLFSLGENGLWLSYLYEPDTVSQLMLSHWKNGAWSSPELVVESDQNDWFVNWADFPSVYQLGDQLVTYILTRRGAAAYAYDIALYHKSEAEESWKGPIFPHRDSTATEHGFVSFFPIDTASTGMVWLDGRNFAEMQVKAEDGLIEPEMMLRFTTIDKNGNLGEDQVLDERVCSCCQTDAAVIPGGAIVVYRDRSEAEVRDIAYLRYQDGAWSEPMSLHNDNWVISGCPVNGPAIDAIEESVAVVWYTKPQETPEVWIVFSDDAGLTFSTPVRVDNGHPLGRLDLKMVAKGKALVSWVEENASEAELKVALMTTTGKIAEQKVAGFPSERGAGFPRLALSGQGDAWLSWTRPGDSSMVCVARAIIK